MDVHHPYVPPEEHQEVFRDEPIGERRAVKLRRKMLDNSETLTEHELTDIFDLYDSEIRFTDSQIQRLVTAAEEYLDIPLIVVTSDHGEEFGEHGTYGHGRLHEECVHVPLIIKHNRMKNTHEELIGLLDIAPTLADYADRGNINNYYGYSLKKLIEEDKGNWERKSVISEYGNINDNYHCSYRDDDWTYISDEDGERLYNRHTDPDERNNIFSKNNNVVDSLKEEITSHVRMLEETQTELDEIKMDDEVAERLEELGYKME